MKIYVMMRGGQSIENSSPIDCKNRDFSDNGTECIKAPCKLEKPSPDLCSTCCMIDQMDVICGFYRECA